MKQSKRTQQFKRHQVQNKVDIALRKIHEWLRSFDKANVLASAQGKPTLATAELDAQPSLRVALQRCTAGGVTQLRLYDVRGIGRLYTSRVVRVATAIREAEDRRRAYTPSLPELLPREAVSEHMTDLYTRKAKAAETGQFATHQPPVKRLRDLLADDAKVQAAAGEPTHTRGAVDSQDDEAWFLDTQE